jgi:polyphosphate kinase
MTRNMLRRVEVAWPVDDPVLHRRVLQECLEPYLRDDTDGWELHADGQYTTAAGAGTAAQHLLMGLLGQQEPT